MRNILLTIKYDGTGYSGWQRQKDKRTVCGRLEEVLSSYFDMDIKLEGTSRTDAGVHAYGQRATLRSDIKVPIEKLPKVINTALADDRLEGMSDIEIVDAKDMPEGFHARFDSKGKRYIYKIRNTKDVDIFQKNYCFHVREALDIDAMRKASEYIVGTHDFMCFQTAGGNPVETTVRTVNKLTIDKEEEFVIVKIEGDGFLYNMVRIIVGTLVDVGLGKKKPEDLKTIIESKDRGNAGKTAPASGLYLDEVFY
ncbi:MAG: tRNA pseudouridine(38-40) synthase TruA [Bacillota bacterium]|nr:tRNA pseudouridine(38-40) synthase TruA [Bacillota bacterium]